MSCLRTCYIWFDKYFAPQLEEKQIVSFIRGLGLASDMRILDVERGGDGRDMRRCGIQGRCSEIFKTLPGKWTG